MIIPPLPDGFSLAAHERLASTNDEARRMARDGAPEGTIVTAEEQTAGRGRQGRVWNSPKGNLYASLVLRPRVKPAQAAQLGFAASLAIGDACQAFLTRQNAITCKWPNDVLINGKKVAGILLESEAEAGGNLRFLILGMGINVASYPQEAMYPATSLVNCGADLMVPGQVLQQLCRFWMQWYGRWQKQGFAALREAWLTRAHGIGAALTARLPDGAVEGTFIGLDENGLMLLDTPSGRRAISAADIFPAVSA